MSGWQPCLVPLDKYDAALQVLWCWQSQKGEEIRIEGITDRFVMPNTAQTTAAKRGTAAIFHKLQELPDDLSKSLGRFQ